MTNPNAQKTFLRAGELAKLAGVSTDTLRYYERKEVLLPPTRTKNNYRNYPPEALTRILLIRKALSLGFTLEELAKIFKVHDQGKVPCQQACDLAKQKLLAIEIKLQELMALRDEWQEILQDWNKRIAEAGPNKKAHLLQSLIK